MVDPFAMALNALFASPMAVDAAYIPLATGVSSNLRVVKSHRMDQSGSIMPTVRVVGSLFDVRISDVSDPQPGDILLTGGHQYELVNRPESDIEGLTWQIEVPLARRYIVLLRYGSAPDSYGDSGTSFAPTAPLPVSFWPIRGVEVENGGEIVARSVMKFVVAWSSQISDLNPRDRAEYDGRTYDIEAVTEIGDRLGLEILASARTDQ